MYLIIDPMWIYQEAQTLQSNNKDIKYFPVRKMRPTSLTDDDASLIQSMIDKAKKQHQQQYLQRHQIINDETGKDTPWLNYTGWKRMFAGVDMTKLVEMTRLAIADDERWLKDVEGQVCQMIEDAYLGITFN